MEQKLHSPEAYDYRQYDRIWQRVAPALEPYPGMRQNGADMTAPSAAVPTAPAQAMTAAPMAASAVPSEALTAAQEARLPGAEMNPCCMGSEAAEMLEVLTGFIEEELGDRCCFLAMVRQAPSWARQRLRDLAAASGARARRLMAVHYLITGECYRPHINRDHACTGRWCPMLRERYHAMACSGLNYARAADGTTDPCLSKLLNELSDDAYYSANELMGLLERALQC